MSWTDMEPDTSTYDAPVVMPSNLDSTGVQALVTAGHDTHKHLVVNELKGGILGTVHNRYPLRRRNPSPTSGWYKYPVISGTKLLWTDNMSVTLHYLITDRITIKSLLQLCVQVWPSVLERRHTIYTLREFHFIPRIREVSRYTKLLRHCTGSCPLEIMRTEE